MSAPQTLPNRARATSGPPTAPRIVGVIWFLLLINVLGFIPGIMIVPVPKAIGQLITMGALVMAFGLALILNPRAQVRPQAYLMVLSLMTLVAIASTLRLESGFGGPFRAVRLTLFVATLWLLSKWWRGDLRVARFHLQALAAVLTSVLIGVAIAPGAAMSGDAAGGRLAGIIWPVPATQVGQYGAVVTGLALLMWVTRTLNGRSALAVAIPAVILMLLSHTRTALAALAVGLLAASLALIGNSARARRAIAAVVGCGTLITLVFNEALLTWLRRGQDEESLTNLTGRQKVWDALLAEERTPAEHLLGAGLTDKSFDGLPIDSSWLAIYWDLGLVGVAVVVVMLGILLVLAALRPPSPGRACAVFLIVYCIVASYTEVGLGDASPYLLHLAVAGALLTGSTRVAAAPSTSTVAST